LLHLHITLLDPYTWDMLQAYMKLHIHSSMHLDVSQMLLKHQMLDA